MARYYGHRITKREREAVRRLYAPRIPIFENPRHVFSHSEQCDKLFSGPVITHPGLSSFSVLTPNTPFAVLANIPSAKQEHTHCRCWCHNAQSLFATPEPEYDLTPPPEYENSADRAFTGIITTGEEFAAYSENSYLDTIVKPSPSLSTSSGNDVTLPVSEHAGSSVTEPKLYESIGKCDTCGDFLTVCECVE